MKTEATEREEEEEEAERDEMFKCNKGYRKTNQLQMQTCMQRNYI